IAIIVLLLFLGGGPALAVVGFSYAARSYAGIFALSWLLSEAPYIFALVRLVRGPDRVGITVSMATGCCQIAFLAFAVLTQFRGLAGLALFSVSPVAEILIVVFAFQLGRMQPAEGDDNAVLAASFGCVAGYLLLVHLALAYLRPGLFR